MKSQAGTRAGNWKRLVLSAAAVMIAGCQQSARQERAAEVVLYPGPPAEARLQYLTGYSGPEDLPGKRSSFLEDLVLGEVETTETINRPYGVAIHAGRIYVCDIVLRRVHVLDLNTGQFERLTTDRRVMNPVNIVIEADGTKYISDPEAQVVFVLNGADEIVRTLGSEADIAPMGLAVTAESCYVTDVKGQRVVELDKRSGAVVRTIGGNVEGQEERSGAFAMIGDVAVDAEGGIYVTDRVLGKVLEFSPAGELVGELGFRSTSVHGLVRPKGVQVDKAGRLWVVDSAAEVTKIYDEQGQLLLFFGLPGVSPGAMNLPAQVVLDEANRGYFEQYAVAGAQIEFVVLVTSQYGPEKVNVYGFGSFPGSAGEVEAENTEREE